MKLVATKLDIETVGNMSKLVIENIDAIARDLTVLDSRLLLGNANVDVVALDGTGALVLVAIDRTSDEQLLLKAVEAYSWCLEYPEAVRRLYPAADVSVSRPPRVMFVVERVSDSFHRKVKQLGFPEVDCVEFRHLAVDGAEVVHFDTVVHLRRATLVSEDTRSATPPSASVATHDNAAPSSRATSMKLQKLLNAEAPAPSTSRHAERPVERPPAERTAAPAATPPPSPAREAGVVVSMVHRAGRHATARHEETAVTRRTVRDAETAEPVGALALESATAAALVADTVVPTAPPDADLSVVPVLELVVEPHPIMPAVLERAVQPQPLAAPAPVEAGTPALDMIAQAPPVDAVEPVIPADTDVEARLIEAVEPPIAVTPALEPVVATQPIEAVEPTIAPAPAVDAVVEPQSIVAAEPVAIAVGSELAVEPTSVAAPEGAAAALAVPEPIASIGSPEPPRISFADLSKELLAAQSVERKHVSPSKPVAPTRPVEPVVSIKPTAGTGVAQRVSLVDLSKELLGTAAPVRTPQANGPTPIRLQVPPVVEAPKSGEMTRSILEQIESAKSEPEAAAAPADAPAETSQTSQPAVLPQEFEGLKFPGDGVLTRQWMDFLNQMTATK